jgi:regulator of replication initiation timing
MPRTRRRTFAAMTKDDLVKEAERMDFTLNKRGRQIGGLYHVIERMFDSKPVKLKDEQPLREQLKEARDQLAKVSRPTEKNQCPVCFEDYGKDHQCVAISCGHVFCEPCLVQVKGHICPYCRKVYHSFLPLYL